MSKKKKFTKKKCKKGIRSNHVNEIWHMDITEFKLKDGNKAYLQVLMDNYSRKVLNWNLSLNKNQSLSIRTIKESFCEYKPQIILTDGGGENIGNDLKRLYLGSNIQTLVAKKDIKFSNSMVEYFFNILK